MAFLAWFSKKEPEDYEQVLESLALDIQKRQTRLSDIRLRERRTTLLLTVYAFAFWVAYVGAWFAGLLPHVSGMHFEHTVKAVPVFIGPIIIQFSRRIVQTWYARIGNAEEKTLKALLAQQRNKVEEIKKKTNYYSTKNLIERYDALPGGSPVRPRPGMPQQVPTTPQRPTQGQANAQMQTPAQGKAQTPVAGLQGAATAGPQLSMVTPHKQWYDKVADALLGEDELSASAAASRYALICQKCFAHNGLVKEELWEDTQYVCPKCGHFNPSVRSLRASRTPVKAPPSPDFSSPQSHRVARPGPRKSAPLSGALLQTAEAHGDRRKSMPALQLFAVDDDERQHFVPRPARPAPLSSTVPLVEDSEESEGEDDTSFADWEEEEYRERVPLAEGDL